MRRSSLLAGAVVMAAAVATGAAPALAAEPEASAEVIGVSRVVLVGEKVFVAGTYRCTGTYHHLWVSAKQGPGDLTQEGSSQIAKSWYQKTYDNTPEGNGDNRVKCDGRVHTGIFKLRHTKGDLHRGRAYVQFCLLAGNTPNMSEETAFDSNQRYRRVVRL